MPDLKTDPAAANPVNSNGLSTGLGTDSSQSDPVDALAHLAKMSGTGSSFGQAEYVAINPLSVATLVLAVMSGLALMAPLFLFLPVVAIACGLVASRQVRNSNGTQSGRMFALGGVVVSLLLGGGVLTHMWMDWTQTRKETRECAAAIAAFGEQIKTINASSANPMADFEKLWNSAMTENFRGRVSAKDFGLTLATVFKNKDGKGNLESIKWSGGPMEFSPIAESDAKMAVTKASIQIIGEAAPRQEYIYATNLDPDAGRPLANGSWKIDNLPRLFPEKKSGVGE